MIELPAATSAAPPPARHEATVARRPPSRPALKLARLRLAERGLTLATGLAAAVPVLVATVRAVRDGWLPVADMGVVATRAWDVFTSHAPLVGQYSYAGRVTGKITHSLGPMLYWLLALPAHFGSPASITWTMGIVNTLAILGVVALARRRGGVVLMFAAAIAVALMCQSLAAETFHDIWNPSAALFPFTLLIFLCWSLACGEYRLLPITALVASFVLQANLTYLPPTLGLLAVGIGGLVLSRVEIRRRRLAGATAVRSDARAEGPDRNASAGDASADTHALAAAARARRPLLRWALAAVAVVVIFWSAPVIDELSERTGNITLVVRSATTPKATLGASVGWHAIVRAVGVRPWWLYVPVDRWQRQYDVREPARLHAVVSCVALLAALFAAMLVAFRRGRRDVGAGALIGLVLCGALGAVAASTPSTPSVTLTLGYTMWWGSQVGMWVWLMIAWSAFLGIRWALRASGRPRPGGLGASGLPGPTPRSRAAASRLLGAPVLVYAAGLVATAAVAVAVAASGRRDEHVAVYRPTASLAASLDRVIPPGRTVNLVANLGYSTTVIKPALRYLLARHGVRALGRGSKVRIGDWYELDGRPFQYVVYLDDGTKSPARRARFIDSVRVVDQKGLHVVSLWVAPHSAAGRITPPAPRPVASRARAGA
ncbi:MAG TPA: hypothetical protein VNY35_12395 [Solirubrobacteraceae bacterium]|nr:hypothetical protein [Solirubrobacteraceae bacterium]